MQSNLRFSLTRFAIGAGITSLLIINPIAARADIGINSTAYGDVALYSTRISHKQSLKS